jgi:membrane dipeptidase
VAVCLATVLARTSELCDPLLDFPSREAASAMAMGQVEYYRLMESKGKLRMLRDAAALDSHVAEWNLANGRLIPLGYILSMEGADPILEPSQVERWWERGLRVVEPVHYGVNYYAHGTGAPGGLTPKGYELLARMERVGMILDVTHLADESLWQSLDAYHGPVMASHHNCRALVPGDRQLSDDQLLALIARDAVIGSVFDAWMLYPGYSKQTTDRSLIGIERVVDHIDHVCQLAGSARHCAIGSDLDGGFGAEQCPHEIDTIADLQILPERLRQRGFRQSDVEGIMHGNWLRFFRNAWSNPASTPQAANN